MIPEILVLVLLVVEKINSKDTLFDLEMPTSDYPTHLAAGTLLPDGASRSLDEQLEDDFPSPVNITEEPLESWDYTSDLKHTTHSQEESTRAKDVGSINDSRWKVGLVDSSPNSGGPVLDSSPNSGGPVLDSSPNSGGPVLPSEIDVQRTNGLDSTSLSSSGSPSQSVQSAGILRTGPDGPLDEPNGSLSYPVGSTTTLPTPPSTRRHIYVRGHLVRAKAHRSFHPAAVEKPDGSFLAPGSVHRTVVKDFRSEPHRSKEEGDWGAENSTYPGATNRRKRKHNTPRKKFHNYKLLYDTMKDHKSRYKETEFYAWIFGAAMLAVGSLTTLTSCFIFCFCGDKMKKRRQMRRRFDKSGEYQRVESVSSIVDHAEQQGDQDDEEEEEEPLDSVTII